MRMSARYYSQTKESEINCLYLLTATLMPLWVSRREITGRLAIP